MIAIKCLGTSRDHADKGKLVMYFNRAPTDDELRYFDEVMKRAAACSPIETPAPVRLVQSTEAETN